MQYSHSCFGSRLDILIFSGEDIETLISSCFDMVDEFEQKYSRFIDGNFLSQLNNTKTAVIDDELVSILKLSSKVSEMTQGYFDITLLPILENKGYGIHDQNQEENFGYKNIYLYGKNLELKQGISIDLGAVGKGYMVDKIYNILNTHIKEFMINFGGDIRVKGTQQIQLEDPDNPDQSIGSIDITNSAIASSAGNKRVFGTQHHLINPKTKQSQQDKKYIYVQHSLASFADTFATALFVTPLQLSLQLIQQTPGLEALIITPDGTIHKSPGFKCDLYIK